MDTHPPLTTLEPTFTATEVATLLRVSPRTVHRLIKHGRLRAIKVGRDYRIPRRAYEAFLNAPATRAAE